MRPRGKSGSTKPSSSEVHDEGMQLRNEQDDRIDTLIADGLRTMERDQHLGDIVAGDLLGVPAVDSTVSTFPIDEIVDEEVMRANDDLFSSRPSANAGPHVKLAQLRAQVLRSGRPN